MLKNTSIVQFQHFLYELWTFESCHILQNQVKVLNVKQMWAQQGISLDGRCIIEGLGNCSDEGGRLHYL